MSHKDMCIDWVVEHEAELDNGYQEIDDFGDPVGPVFKTLEELEEVLWEKVLDKSWSELASLHPSDL